ncbi:MAG: DUF370 domain-containing protein [Clostridia bacterium]|nr:DUF370 domain-containing protein [Clostridia bacterium]
MYVHIGNDFIINDEDIVAVFDIDSSSISVKTRNFLNNAEKNKEIVNISTDIPRSFIVCKKNNKNIVYLSQLSSSTIGKRINKNKKGDFIL